MFDSIVFSVASLVISVSKAQKTSQGEQPESSPNVSLFVCVCQENPNPIFVPTWHVLDIVEAREKIQIGQAIGKPRGCEWPSLLTLVELPAWGRATFEGPCCSSCGGAAAWPQAPHFLMGK